MKNYDVIYKYIYLYVKIKMHTCVHTTRIFIPLKNRCEFRLLCLMNNTLIQVRPGYLRSLFVRRQILQHLRSSDATLLELPNGCNAMQSRSFSRMAPARRNTLPYYLRKLKSPRTFANYLKYYLN